MSGVADLLPPALIQILGWTLLHFLWQGALVAALVAAVTAVIGGRRQNLRYAVACAGLLLLVACPMVTAWSGLVSTSTDNITVSSQLLPATVDPARAPESGPSLPFRFSISSHSLDAYLPVLVDLWLIGSSLLFVRLYGGFVFLHSLQRSGRPPDHPSWQRRVNDLARRTGIHSSIQLLESARIAVPAVVGLLRPAIVVPVGLLAGMAPSHVEAILVHELAHIRRWDGLVNLLQSLAESLLFFHPAVWWVSHRIRVEREFCCDDVVVSVCSDAGKYARALSLLEDARTGRLALAASGGQLLLRIRRLLGTGLGRVPPNRLAPTLAPLSLASVLLVAILSIQLHEPGREVADTIRGKIGSVSRLAPSRPEAIPDRDLIDRMPQAATRPEVWPEPVVATPATVLLGTVLGSTRNVSAEAGARSNGVLRTLLFYGSTFEPLDPRFWLGEYQGTADVRLYRARYSGREVLRNGTWDAGRAFTMWVGHPPAVDSQSPANCRGADLWIRFGIPWEAGKWNDRHSWNFLVDLEFGRIDGRYYGEWNFNAVEASVLKVGDNIRGTLKCFSRESGIDSPFLPIGEYRFEATRIVEFD